MVLDAAVTFSAFCIKDVLLPQTKEPTKAEKKAV